MSAPEVHSPEWHENRRQGIGGSDAPAVLGCSRWRSPLELYAEKTGAVQPNTETTDAQHFGNILETVVAEEYARRTGRMIRRRNKQQVHREYDFMRAHLDRVIVSDPRGIGVLQVKTAASWKAKEWEEEPPIEYQVQIQHEMEVAGASWGSFAVLIGGNSFVWMDVEPNERFVAKMIEAERMFWHCVQTETPPPLSDVESDARAIAALFPCQTDITPVALPVDAVVWDEARQSAADEIKRLTALKKDAENHIKSAMGGHAVAYLPDGTTYTWKDQHRAEYVVKASSFRVLRRGKGGCK